MVPTHVGVNRDHRQHPPLVAVIDDAKQTLAGEVRVPLLAQVIEHGDLRRQVSAHHRVRVGAGHGLGCGAAGVGAPQAWSPRTWG